MEIALASLKVVFGIAETLASTLVGLVTRIAAKICAYTLRLPGQPSPEASAREDQ